MIARRQFSRSAATRLAWLAVAAIAGLGGLFFAAYKLIHARKLPAFLTARRIDDGLMLALLVIVVGLVMAARPSTLRAEAPARKPFRWRVAIPLIGLILIAAYLRFHGLGFQSLWHDEFLTNSHVTSDNLVDVVTPTGRIFDSWPAFHIPLYFFVHLAGDTEFALRFPSALAGVLLTPVVFVIGRRMFSDREGLIAAGLAATIEASVEYSQEARMYGMLMLLAALSGYFWFRMAQDMVWKRKPGRMVMVGYAATIILMPYLHYFGLLLIGVEGLGTLLLVLYLRRIPIQFVVVYAAFGLAYLPWTPLLYIDANKSVFWLIKPDTSFNSTVEFITFLFGQPFSVVAAITAAAGLAVALWPALRKGKDRQGVPLAIAPGIVLGAWLVLPFAIAYWRSVVSTPILVDRYLLISLPAVCLLLARAVTRLPVPATGTALAGFVVVGVPLVSMLVGPYYAASTKPELRQAIQYIASRDRQYPGALIVGSSEPLNYYYPRFGTTPVADLNIVPLDADSARQAIDADKPRYIWFIGQQFVYNRSLPDSVAGDYRQVDEQEFYLVSLLLYERK